MSSLLKVANRGALRYTTQLFHGPTALRCSSTTSSSAATDGVLSYGKVMFVINVFPYDKYQINFFRARSSRRFYCPGKPEAA